MAYQTMIKAAASRPKSPNLRLTHTLICLARARIPYLSCIAMISRWNRQRHFVGCRSYFRFCVAFSPQTESHTSDRAYNKQGKNTTKNTRNTMIFVRVLTWRDPLSAQSCGILSVILLRSYFGINMAMFLLCTTVSTTGYVVHNST